MIKLGDLVSPTENAFGLNWGTPDNGSKYPWIARSIRRRDRGVVVAIQDEASKVPCYVIEIEPGRYGSALARYLQVEALLPPPDTNLFDLERARAIIKELSHD